MRQAVRHRIFARGKRLLDLAGSIGLDARDNDETALRKRVAVVLFGGTLPLTIAWSAIYLAVGAPLAAAVPGFYSVITPINTLVFAHTRNLRIYRFTQLLLVLILPWLVMISLSGFRQSSAVVVWIAGFIALLIVGAILEPYLPQANLPQAFIASFYVLYVRATAESRRGEAG